MLENWLLGKKYDSMRSGILWNSVASIEYSLQSAILVLTVTRIIGLHDAGIFIFAYTIAQLLTTIGNYGMRGFQVSDSRQEYSFQEYVSLRLISALVMVGIGVAYSYLSGISALKRVLSIILCTYRMLESMEDVFHAELQKRQRLDVGAKIETIRIFIATLAFIVCCFATHNIVAASMAMFLACLFMVVFLNVFVMKSFPEISFRLNYTKLHNLFFACLPICVCDFLYNYLINEPKYAIERNLSEEAQAIFSILFMPIFVVNLLSIFIYKPFIANMGIYWENKDIKKFSRIIFKQIVAIVFLTFIMVVGGMTVGLELMEYVYIVELTEYKELFMILLIFGGVAALDTFFVVILTVMRKQYCSIAAYALAILCVRICMNKAVCTYGLWGAGIIYGIAMGIVMIVLFSVVFNTLKRLVQWG